MLFRSIHIDMYATRRLIPTSPMQQFSRGGFACCMLLACLLCSSFQTKSMALRSQRKMFLSDRLLSFEPASITVLNASDFIMALYNIEIINILIAVPELTVNDADWANYSTPLLLQRNMTIASSDLLEDMTILRFYTRRRVQLGNYTTLTLERVVLNPVRLRAVDNLSRSPGLDLLMPSTPDTKGAMVLVRDAAFVIGFCLPTTYRPFTMGWLPRLAGVPGSAQLSQFSVPQPGCVNSSSAPAMKRCWANRDVYVDLATPGADTEVVGTLPQPCHYGIWLLNVTSLCERVIPMDCLAQQDVIYCVIMAVGNMSSAPKPPQLQSEGTHQLHPPSVGDASERKVLLAALLGSLLGVAVLSVLVAAAVLLWWRRREKESACHEAPHAIPTNSEGDMPNRAPSQSQELCTVEGDVHGSGGAGTAEDTPTSTESQETLKSNKEGSVLPLLHLDECDTVLTEQSRLNPGLNLEVQLEEPLGGTADGVHQAAAATATTTTTVAAAATTATKDSSDAGPGNNNPGNGANHSASHCDVVTLLAVVRGQGAFGRVVEGLYRGERVAVKRVMGKNSWAAEANEQALVEPLIQEIEVLGRCHHPNIVRLLAACLRPPCMCLVLELMDTSLDRLIYSNRQQPLPVGLVWHIAIEVCKGLAYLHPTVIHRDLKPGNVLINDPWGDQPTVKITDFGLSRLRDTLLVTMKPEAGTAAYTAPECFDLGSPAISHHSDMYSFGVLLWELLAGCPPWAGLDLLQIAVRVCVQGHRLPVPPPALPPAAAHRWPPEVCHMLRQCWEREPRRRPAAAEMAKELMAFSRRQQQRPQ